ncbi:uncharacterized protein LOC115775254 isoform X2 [Archocentrus centrarchus]|uniref:uncharacterized protein LOC115775254 isoform X2 n=1 Tax=Archocentrus centrarchus TaxID=63155 RepID=UPI0011E9E081|nr:uncharacterized protein LOC115775254 isoform X2 [Archocentrus centrarchus]
MFASDHLKIHGFSSSGRFLTTYRKDYGALRERYPQLNSSSTEVERAPSFTGPLQPPSSSFLPARVPSSDIRTTSISLATQDVASILSEDQTQDAGVAGDAQRLLGKEGEAQCHHGYVENVWQQQEAKDTKTEIIYKEGVVAVSSSDGLPSCNDFLIHLLKENGLQHLLDTPSGWTPVVTNKDTFSPFVLLPAVQEDLSALS